MGRIPILLSFLILLGRASFSQVFTDSNLPIIIIKTDNGTEIPDDPKVPGTMKIISRGEGQRNYLSDQNNSAFLNYEGRIEIEIRGSSSQESPKKQYGFTTYQNDRITKDNVSLLGMPEENDWILNGMVFDPARIRDFLSYNLSRQIGEYASRTAYCEVVINDNYKGLYVLQEKIKADDNRVNIIKIGSSDLSLPDVTGGYITKADKTTGGDPVAWTMLSWTGATVGYIHELPKPEDVKPQQDSYIHNRFNLLEKTALEGNSSVRGGYPSIIDIPSFIDFMIINELGSNADAYTYSTFFHKDRNGKLRAGPVWDLDLTYGNDLFFWGYDRSKSDVWQFSTGDNDGSRFWKDLFSDPLFRCYFSKRWNSLAAPGKPLNQSSLYTFIDQTVSTISEAVSREYYRWGITSDFNQSIEDIKSFISARLIWITTNLGSYADCSDVPVPELVITKIMYHPVASSDFPDNEDLEFIEISNEGDQTIDMTGIYFGGTGFVYCFPAGSSVSSHSSVILASNASAFHKKYGVPAYGQFTRHLSDKSEDLVLADAFGNIIDNVTYSDTTPWPDADGNGKYLSLSDASLDNSLGENWTASAEAIVSVQNIPATPFLALYPNPVYDILNALSGTEIRSISIYDISGREIMTVQVNGQTCELNLGRLTKGIYFVRVVTPEKTFQEKIIKN